MKRILIIEDEQDIVDIATLILEDEGYEVCSMTDFEGYESKVEKMSANKDIEMVKIEAGADAFISKPFDLEHFIQVIRAQIT